MLLLVALATKGSFHLQQSNRAAVRLHLHTLLVPGQARLIFLQEFLPHPKTEFE